MVGEEKAKSRRRSGKEFTGAVKFSGLRSNLNETGGGKLTEYPGQGKKRGKK